MQLRLFHPTRYERGGARPPEGTIEIVNMALDAARPHAGPYYAWRCGSCGRRGMGLSWPRPDRLAWARENHRCQKTEETRNRAP